MTNAALQTAYKSLLQRGRLTPDKHQATLVARLSLLQDELLRDHNAIKIPGQKPPAPQGLYIYGSVGTGKSRLADLFASTLPPQVSHRRSHFNEFMLDIHSRLHVARKSTTYSGDPLISIGRTIAAESKVLCFDEFQVTDIADAMILKRLFEGIWRDGGVMVSTSNRPPEDLYENGLNRELFLPFVKEVRRRSEVWEIGGKEDYRMKGGGGGDRSETFFLDRVAFEAKLNEVIGKRDFEGVKLPVYGSRELKVNAVRKSDGAGGKKDLVAVTGTFDELCETSLGSGDYHALAAAAENIFISGLRCFRTSERDAVRRFITLVDLAYESKARVTCLSEVPLAEVFKNIVPQTGAVRKGLEQMMRVKGEGGSSSSMMSTFIGEMEWSATGLAEASLATGGAGETDVGFAVGRAVSRLYEMGSAEYGVMD